MPNNSNQFDGDFAYNWSQVVQIVNVRGSAFSSNGQTKLNNDKD